MFIDIVFLELLVTFLLVFVVFGTAVDNTNGSGMKSLAPIPIGFAVVVGVSIAFGFTGGSLVCLHTCALVTHSPPI